MRFVVLIIIVSLFSCSSKKDESIIIPPSFAEIPDIENPEKISDKKLKEQQEKDVARLKELLLQSD
ncbi:MAG: hypothetical protein ISQ34_05115 [Rickettsiales bacterium]|nr:hypothetical protein [Rickettsiales bacterium]